MKPVPSCAAGSDAIAGQTRQALTEVNRSRACTSAAMLGLAISMGASNMLVPQASEAAVTNHIPASDQGNWLSTSPMTDLSSDLDTANTANTANILGGDDHQISQSSSASALVQDLPENIDRLSAVENQGIGLDVREIGAVLSEDSRGAAVSPHVSSHVSTHESQPIPTEAGKPQPSFVVTPAGSSQPEYFFSATQPSTPSLTVSLPSVNQWSGQNWEMGVSESTLTNSAPTSNRTIIPGSPSYTAHLSGITDNQEMLTEAANPLMTNYQNPGTANLEFNPRLDSSQVSIEFTNPVPLSSDLGQANQTDAMLPSQDSAIISETSVAEAAAAVAEVSQPGIAAGSEMQDGNYQISRDAEKPTQFQFTAEPLPIEANPEANPQANLEANPEASAVAVPDLTNTVVISPTPVSSASRIYQVGEGETLDQIAQKNNISVSDLIAANQISDPNFIKADQKIKIPLVNQEKSTSLNQSTIQEQSQADASIPETLVNEVSAPVVLGTDAIYPLAPTRRSKGNLNRQDSTPIPLVNGKSGKEFAHGAPAKSSDVNNGLKSDLLKLREKYPTGQSESQYQSLNPELPIDSAAKFSDQLVTVPELVAPTQLAQVSQNAATHTVANNPVANHTLAHNYVQGLRADIERLRQNYRQNYPDRELVDGRSPDPNLSNSLAQEETNVDAENFSASAPQFLQAAVGEQRKKRQRSGTPLPESAKPAADQESNSQNILATGSGGTAAYQPLLQPTLGQMVSPQLPPLNGPEAYLPKSPAVFNGYIWPAQGILTSGYGWRWGRMHNGIDIAAPVGTPIFAAASGVVTFAGWNNGGYGNLVEIEHPDGSVTLYAHNSRILVREGQEVDQGEQVAEMGSTGFSTGPHLHFEIHPPGQGAVNPMAFLPRER